MIVSFLEAPILIGIPVFVLTFFLIFGSLKKKKIRQFSSPLQLERNIKLMKRWEKRLEEKGDKKQDRNFIYRWLKFGGGFYGAAALYTITITETIEIIQFIFKMLNPNNWTLDIGIGHLISFLWNSLENFLNALIWFAYWSSDGIGLHSVIWLATAYIAFYAGSKLAQDYYKLEAGETLLWVWPDKIPEWLRSVGIRLKPAPNSSAN